MQVCSVTNCKNTGVFNYLLHYFVSTVKNDQEWEKLSEHTITCWKDIPILILNLKRTKMLRVNPAVSDMDQFFVTPPEPSRTLFTICQTWIERIYWLSYVDKIFDIIMFYNHIAQNSKMEFNYWLVEKTRNRIRLYVFISKRIFVNDFK
jgi:hypothetical protein